MVLIASFDLPKNHPPINYEKIIETLSKHMKISKAPTLWLKSIRVCFFDKNNSGYIEFGDVECVF